MGNTCRSPMAATIMSNLMPDMRCESRGVVVLFPEPYNPKAVAVASRHELISAMAAESQMSKADAKKALDAFITSVTNAMKAGDKVSLVGFGTFSVSERAERTGINPSTKATITIPAKKVAKFKAGAELSAAVE